MNTQHTPTPWSFANDEIYARNSRIIHTCFRGDMQGKRDAEFIVRAVNSHEALVIAAKDSAILLADIAKDFHVNLQASPTFIRLMDAINQAEGKS